VKCGSLAQSHKPAIPGSWRGVDAPTRHVATRERIARFLLLGWTGERIAERLNCSTRQVRYAVATPEFQTLFDHLQKEHFKALGQKMHRLLQGAVTALHRQLKHPDWRARDAAIEKVLRVHGTPRRLLKLSRG
jgi:hypothetical protein